MACGCSILLKIAENTRHQSGVSRPKCFSQDSFAATQIEDAFASQRVVGCASVEHSQHVGYEDNQQYRAQSYACTPAITPAAMAVVPSAAP
jgi:hypothetical protein